VPLADLFDQTSQNIRLAPRDLVRVIYTPRMFTTFGSLMHSAQMAIGDAPLTLAGALGQAGGLDPNSANATAVLLFRFERPDIARALQINAPVSPKGVPVIYHLDMRDPEEWFVASQFNIEPNDLIYVPQSNYVEMQKFLAIVGSISSVAYNFRVTSQVAQ
jgi:polysaccharide biosynthesis/export protein